MNGAQSADDEASAAATAAGTADEPANAAASVMPSATRWGLLNWLLLMIGAVLLLVGFHLLNKADAWAENVAAALSPFCLLGGYAFLFLSLIVRPAK